MEESRIKSQEPGVKNQDKEYRTKNTEKRLK
jgi:hypothetical protein